MSCLVTGLSFLYLLILRHIVALLVVRNTGRALSPSPFPNPFSLRLFRSLPRILDRDVRKLFG
jgi:hypothetical protein